MDQAEPTTTNQQPPQEKASIFQIVRAVLWSMLGVRQQKGYEDDTAKITLKQAVIAGIIGGVIFVCSMLTVVNLVINYANK
jgi:hypothetical protein